MPAKIQSKVETKKVAPKAPKKAAHVAKSTEKPKAIKVAPKTEKKSLEAKSAPEASGKSKKTSGRNLKTTSVTNASVEVAKEALSKEKGAKESTKAEEKAATGPLAQKWTALFKKASAIESKPYNMKSSYSEKTAIVHKHLGWGYILANRNDRLEVLFKDGIRYLISNYK